MKRIAWLAVFFSLFASLMSVAAEELSDIKGRMRARRAALKTLVAAQKAGENQAGYLTARGEMSPDEQRLLDAENTDRKQVYAAIAAKTGATVEQVHSMFMNSPAHRDNIVNGRYDRIGTGVAQAGGRLYVVQVFAG